jgi:hypothetical protein
MGGETKKRRTDAHTAASIDDDNRLRPELTEDDLMQMSVHQLLNVREQIARSAAEHDAVRASTYICTREDVDAALAAIEDARTTGMADDEARNMLAGTTAEENMRRLRQNILTQVRSQLNAGAPVLPYFKREEMLAASDEIARALRTGVSRAVAELAVAAHKHEKAGACIEVLRIMATEDAIAAVRGSLRTVRGAKGNEMTVRAPIDPGAEVPQDEVVNVPHLIHMSECANEAGARPCRNGGNCYVVRRSCNFVRDTPAGAFPPCREYLSPWEVRERVKMAGAPARECVWCILYRYELLWTNFTRTPNTPRLAPRIAFARGFSEEQFHPDCFYRDYVGDGDAIPTGMGGIIQSALFALRYVATPAPHYDFFVCPFWEGRGRGEPRGRTTPSGPSCAATSSAAADTTATPASTPS